MSDEKTGKNPDDLWIWRKIEWKNPETWVPGYGNWGGPGYSAGKYAEEISEEDSQNSPRKITVNGVERPSPVDDLLNTDFSQYLPEVDKLKIFEIDKAALLAFTSILTPK